MKTKQIILLTEHFPHRIMRFGVSMKLPPNIPHSRLVQGVVHSVHYVHPVHKLYPASSAICRGLVRSPQPGGQVATNGGQTATNRGEVATNGGRVATNSGQKTDKLIVFNDFEFSNHKS